MSKKKQIEELNVDLIGGETLTESEKQQLKAFFRKQKEKQKKRSTRVISTKKIVTT